MTIPLFEDFDFSLLDSADFKEDSVREEIVMPILRALGYSRSGTNRIISSKKLTHPFVQTGTKTRKIINYPDYLLTVKDRYVWVMDAKAPDELITSGANVEQTFFYAIHPEIRVPLYALCNGREFIVFAIDGSLPLIHFRIEELNKYWTELSTVLSPDVITQKKGQRQPKPSIKRDLDYSAIVPPIQIKDIQKQSAARHFGVHGYFTKQPFKVVRAHIDRFTKPGDVVLDPYGGSGVTAIEALMLGRKAIHVDINPMSAFITKNLISPVDLVEFADVFTAIASRFKKEAPRRRKDVANALEKYAYPRDVPLMKNADVASIEQLFTPLQIAQLAFLKHLIMGVKDRDIRDSLLLAFSSTITKINLTYHPSTTRGDNAGDSAAFRYYRYRIAKDPVDLDVLSTFTTKVKKLVKAKQEIAPFITRDTMRDAHIYKGSATDLSGVEDESIDYIYTDPPYGSKIPYLDLSVMWNEWLGLRVTKSDLKLEAIEGGEQNKSKKEYAALIAQSIREMYRVLKFDRWMSFVFNHKDPAYWHLIVNTAEAIGFEYAGAIEQASGQASFKKRQNPFTVLRGQLIITFRKVRNPTTLAKYALGTDVTSIILQTVEGLIAKEHGATIDQINSEVMIRAMEMAFLDILSKQYQDLTPFLRENFDYDRETEEYHIRKNTKFKTTIPIELRVRYYTYSYLKRMSFQRRDSTFDEIVLYIMPLLKNGVTPEKETILKVLDEIAFRVGQDRWRLKATGQAHLFDGTYS